MSTAPQQSLGLHFNAGGIATLVVWAPLRQAVAVRLAGQDLPLWPQANGYWQLTTDQLKPGDCYALVLDGQKAYPDPASLAQPDGVHGFSAAVNLLDFAWTDAAWQNIPLADYILYELHVGTFTPPGTFAALAEKLDYLRELGVTAIELMPVAQFPGTRNWGYDGVFPYAVHHSYGGAHGLQQLIDACHQRGLAVVLDVVYNHLGPEGNYLAAYGPYFTDKYTTPWGPALNFDDAGSDGVRHYFIQNALMWFRDFHVDALRLDAVHAIEDASPTHFLRELKQHVDQLTEATDRPYYLIAEVDRNDPLYINPLTERGYGLDAQWVDDFHHALRVTATGERRGYYTDFNGLDHLAKSYQDAYVYDGQYAPQRGHPFGVKTYNPGHQFVVYAQNHDQVGNRPQGERTSRLVSFAMQKLMAGAVLISPFVPLLFMGEEYAESHPFFYFVSHTDPRLIAAVRRGRQAELAAFPAAGALPDPQAESTFQQSKLQWELINQEPHRTLFRYYQTLIALRKNEPALRHLHRRPLTATPHEENKTLLLLRRHEDQQILCLLNFSPLPQPVTLPAAAQWQKLFDSADPRWRGSAAAPELVTGGAQLLLQPESLVIYANA